MYFEYCIYNLKNKAKLMEFEESIFNLIPKEAYVPPK